MSMNHTFGVFLVSACALLAGTAPAQEGRSTTSDVEQSFADQVAALQQARYTPAPGDNVEVSQLAAARYNVAVEEYRIRCDAFKQNKGKFSDVLDAYRRLYQASNDLRLGRPERGAIQRQVVDMAAALERVAEHQADSNHLAPGDLEYARFCRLEAELNQAMSRPSAGGR